MPYFTASVAPSTVQTPGARVRNAHAGDRMAPRILAGKGLQRLGKADIPHTFSYVPDLAAAFAAAAAETVAWCRSPASVPLPP